MFARNLYGFCVSETKCYFPLVNALTSKPSLLLKSPLGLVWLFGCCFKIFNTYIAKTDLEFAAKFKLTLNY